MASEFSPSPPKYMADEVDRLQEGVAPSDEAEQVMAILIHDWSVRGDHDNDAEQASREMLSGEGVTVAAKDKGGVVVATATYKPDKHALAASGWAILQGVAELPEADGDPNGEEQRSAALRKLGELARANGVTRLTVEHLMDMEGVWIMHYIRHGYTPLAQSPTRYAELCKYLQSPEE